ncbi:DUF4822 domain-containing protein [Taibaiella soli]|uniref:DUF4822 domain-containing protein n=1 Tax=Taibaiella soli TaxID=1649169 RepID=A0A2W2B392_9BACT|nr:DUF4822 domain-containing protein [Taibaiella soli]PZF74754.1 DUF4822 domain-containing protein [Taibaiella soli]
MNNLKKLSSVLFLAVCSIVFFSCKKDSDTAPKQLTPSETLASISWLTTNAKNSAGADVALNDPNVSNFVGYAYFKADGTFTMFNLDDSPKMHGDWSVPADGKTRTVVAKDANGAVLFTRVVDIVVLTQQEFTYRVFPDATDKTIYFDIIHTPTTHTEPK